MTSEEKYYFQEKQMVSGQIYDAYDENLSKKRMHVRMLAYKYNKTSPKQGKLRAKILKEIFKSTGRDIYMEPTINFDYGCNTSVGDYFFANYNCVILDVAPVTVGNGVMFGPNVTIAPPLHPLVARERIIRQDDDGNLHDIEYAKPIVIGNNVWIASNSVVCGGVTIGDNSVIGAGSVVTRDIPADVIAVGNPCKVLREITDEDLVEKKFNREQRLKSSL